MFRISMLKLATSVALLFCLNVSSDLFGQGRAAVKRSFVKQFDTSPGILPLRQGDRMSDYTFRMLANFPTESVNLYDIRGKLIIIDFWTTWCSACIQNFHKMDSLQQLYKDKLQVILVNELNEDDVIKQFFLKRKTTYQLAVSGKDTILNKYFLHKSVPHYVWIDSNYTVRAITSSEQVTGENIERIINDNAAALPDKDEGSYRLFDESESLSDQLKEHGTSITYSSTLSGYADKIKTTALRIRKDENGGIIRAYIINNTIFNIFRDFYQAYLPKNRIILDVKDASKIFQSYEDDVWLRNNTYCYELILPSIDHNQLINIVSKDMLQYLGLRGYYDKRLQDCYIVTLKDSNRIVKSSNVIEPTNNFQERGEGKKFAQKMSIGDIIGSLSLVTKPIFIDQTGYNELIDIEFPNNLENTNELIEAFNKYGFHVKKEKRMIEVFVISDRPN